MDTPHGAIQFVNLHLPTPRDGIESFLGRDPEAVRTIDANTVLRSKASLAASHWIEQWADPLLIAGDFNTPVESAIYRNFWGHYTNAFSRSGFGWGYTKRTRWMGARIDHILGSPEWRCRRAWVGPDVGSDHLPVLADWDYLPK
jgi:endonuclease/exonuclease/phosphatase (EEP) superfamily protein YafD